VSSRGSTKKIIGQIELLVLTSGPQVPLSFGVALAVPVVVFGSVRVVEQEEKEHAIGDCWTRRVTTWQKATEQSRCRYRSSPRRDTDGDACITAWWDGPTLSLA
jgi:hypothetical protein